MQVRVPADKVQAICQLISDVLARRSIQLKPLQSLIGSLNFMCRAIAPGRPFCRRLINATCGLTKPHHHLRISPGMRQDLKMWLCFFQSFNGVSMFHNNFWSSNEEISLYTVVQVASGFGAYFGGKWTYSSWPEELIMQRITQDITVLELFPILVAVSIWGQELVNKKLLFRCDNQAVVCIINTQLQNRH